MKDKKELQEKNILYVRRGVYRIGNVLWFRRTTQKFY
jgi:hypothetical protein